MQQKLQKLFSLFLIATSIISCQQEEEFVQNNQYLSKINQYKVQRKTFDDLLKDNRISSFAKKYQSESVFHKSNANNRIIYANDGSFSIDTEQSIYIEDPETSSTSYTFQVSRSETDSVNNNYLENIVISFPSEGYYQITLIRYELTDQEKEDIENGYVIDLSDNIIYTTQLDDIVIGSEIEGRFYVNQNGNCFTLIEETCNCYTHTDQTGYEDCLETCHNEQVVWTFCNEEGGGGTTAQDEDPDYDENGYDAIPNTGNDTNTGSNDPSSGSTNSDNQSNTYTPTTPINTSPFYTDLKAKDRIRNFKTHLSFDQNIFLTNNPDIKNEIYNYLENQVNDLTDITYPQDAIDLVKDLIDFAIEQMSLYGNTLDNQGFITETINDILNPENDNIEEEEVVLPPDCESFNFEPTNSNWQEAAVINIHFQVNIISPQGIYVNHIVEFPQPILFGCPIDLIIGNTNLTPGLAASASAQALKLSMNETVKKFGNKTVSSMIVELYFKERLKYNYPFFIPGGRVNFNANNINVVPTQYQTNVFGTGNCN